MRARVEASDVKKLMSAVETSLNSFSDFKSTFSSGIDDLIYNLQSEIQGHTQVEGDCSVGKARGQTKIDDLNVQLRQLEATLANTPETITVTDYDSEGNEIGSHEERNPEYDRLLEEINNVQCKINEVTNIVAKFEELSVKINGQRDILQQVIQALKNQKEAFNSFSSKSLSSFESAKGKLASILSIISDYLAIRINAVSSGSGHIGGFSPGGYSAKDKLIDYLQAKGYGPQDYTKYSSDPEWQKLNNAYIESLKNGVEVVEVMSPEFISEKKEELIRHEIYQYLKSLEKNGVYKFKNDDEMNSVIDAVAGACGVSAKIALSQNGNSGIVADIGKTIAEASVYAIANLAQKSSSHLVEERSIIEKVANDTAGIKVLNDSINSILNAKEFSPSQEDINERNKCWAAIDSLDTGDFVKNSILKSNLIMLFETSDKMVRLYDKDSSRVNAIHEASDLANSDENFSLDKNLRSKFEKTIVTDLLKMINSNSGIPVSDIERDNSIIQQFNLIEKQKYGDSSTRIKEKSVVKEASSKLGSIVKKAVDSLGADEIISTAIGSSTTKAIETSDKIFQLKRNYINECIEAKIKDEIALATDEKEHECAVDLVKEQYIKKCKDIYLEAGISVLTSVAKQSADKITDSIDDAQIKNVVDTINKALIDEIASRPLSNESGFSDLEKEEFLRVAETVIDLDSINPDLFEDGELKSILEWRNKK